MFVGITRVLFHAMKKTVVIGLLEPTLNRARHDERRWQQWRPTVSIGQHEDLLVDRFELLYQQRFRKVADQVASDLAQVSPETRVVHNNIEFRDAWDFQDVYEALHEFAKVRLLVWPKIGRVY